MPKFTKLEAKRLGLKNKHRRGGQPSGPTFIQLPHYVKRSTSYHGLSAVARCLLTELIDRYNGSNNGFIALGVREAAYELGCHQGTISRAARELDDADLARPTLVGAWRGRHATEWRLTWKFCNKTHQLPRKNWQDRKRYHQELLPPPAKKPLSNAERAKRYRRRQAADRHENRHDELHQESAEVALREHRRDASLAARAQNGNSLIASRNPSCSRGAHVHDLPPSSAAEVRET